MTGQRGRSGHQPGVASAEAADVGERVQARFVDRRARGDIQPYRLPSAALPPAVAPAADVVAADGASLQTQLDLLRRQLDATLGEMEARIEVAGTGAAAALKLAEEANQRAQVASARAARVVAAAEGLAAELGRLTPALPVELGAELDGALDRFRSGLQSA